MQGVGGFHGRQSADTNRGIQDGETKMLTEMKKKGLFSANYKKSIDMRKIKFETLKPWIAKKCEELMGFDDDIVVEYVYSQLEFEKTDVDQKVEPEKLQMNLTPFLGKHAAVGGLGCFLGSGVVERVGFNKLLSIFLILVPKIWDWRW